MLFKPLLICVQCYEISNSKSGAKLYLHLCSESICIITLGSFITILLRHVIQPALHCSRRACTQEYASVEPKSNNCLQDPQFYDFVDTSNKQSSLYSVTVLINLISAK